MGIFFDISDLKNEVLNESKIGYDSKCKISIHVTPDGDYPGGEDIGYFKVCRGDKFDNGSCIRIRFCDPIYEYHGRKKLQLKNSKEAEAIMKILNSKVSASHLRKVEDVVKPYIKTEWQYAIYLQNLNQNVKGHEMIKYSDQNIDLNDIKMNTRMIKLNQSMPDYTELEVTR